MGWEINGDVWIEKNEDGFAGLIRHLQHPFTDRSVGGNAPKLAVLYLQTVRDLLGLTADQINELERTIDSFEKSGTGDPSTRNGPQLRWKSAIRLRRETGILLIQETHDGATAGAASQRFGQTDVEGAGLRIMLHRVPTDGSLRITGLVSTLRRDFHFGDKPSPVRTFVLQRPITNAILDNFGFNPLPPGAPIPGFDVVIHRYQPQSSLSRPTTTSLLDGSGNPTAGSDYIAFVFRLIPSSTDPAPDHPAAAKPGSAAGEPTPSTADHDLPPYELVARASDDFAPLASRVLLTHAVATGSGLVFEMDPICETGDFALRPNAPEKRLNPQRRSMPLQNLTVPGGGPPQWRLSGTHVTVDGDPGTPPICGTIGIAPPIASSPDAFTFGSRTNHFAAVNAYYHSDAMFSLLDTYLLPFNTLAMNFQLPARIIHRAAIRPGPCTDGRCINAQLRIIPAMAKPSAAPPPPTNHCDPGHAAQPQVQFRFALADLMLDPGSAGNPLAPLGIACDRRVVWHEFCHAVLAAATGNLEFPFAHSAGDALAAIMCDPGSKLAEGDRQAKYRGVTFPWGFAPPRRHDRKAADGWSWHEALGELKGYHHDIRDMFGYSREQVLSSTLFRLYQALGGDAETSGGPDLLWRCAAADYAAYLILRAIASLGPAVTVPAANAGVFAAALMDADIGTLALTSPAQTAIAASGRIGGTAHKVVRWAFEKQGLYVRPGVGPAPDGSGSPDPIDVFIEDGRHGEYDYVPSWLADPGAAWNRHAPDGLAVHQDPLAGENNYIYIRAGNRGYQNALNVQASVYVAPSSADPVWPDPSWTALPAVGGSGSGTVAAGASAVLGPFLWSPDDAAIFRVLSAVDAIGDHCNINAATGLPCAVTPGPLDFLVPLDNNLGLSLWEAQ